MKHGKTKRRGSPGRVLTVSRREAGVRLDLFLTGALESMSRRQAKRLIDGHRVSVDGRIEPMASRLLAAGETVRVVLPEPQPPAEAPEPTVLYEDADCLAVLKPPGIPSGPTRDAARAHVAGLVQATMAKPLTLLHRLDRDTTGILLFAKTSSFAQALADDFRTRNVEKTYLAVVRGRPPRAFEAVIYLKEGEGGRMLVVRSGGVRAETAFRTVAVRGAYALVEARPRTGRTHQIRVQLAQAGHPILGDSLYGGDALVVTDGEEKAVPRQMLHAWKLSFRHPTLGRQITLEAPIPEDFRCLAEALFGRLVPT